jgi:hypothetical protein
MRLGNERPEAIRSLENKIWQLLFNLATSDNSTSKDVIDAIREILESEELTRAEEFAQRTEYSLFKRNQISRKESE